MNIVKKTVSAVGGIVLAALLIAALAPKATHALVAALVQVANTSANPVPNRDVDNPARDTFQATFASSCTGSGFTLTSCTGLTVPATNGSGEPISMFVIEYASGGCSSSGANQVILFNYSLADINSHLSFSDGFVDSSTSGNFLQYFVANSAGFAEQTRLYAAPGTTISALSSTNCFAKRFGISRNAIGARLADYAQEVLYAQSRLD